MPARREIVERLRRKAATSVCRYRIAAMGLSAHGDVIASATNRVRFSRKGGGIHAEQAVMMQAGRGLKTVIVLRLGNAGAVRPIEPCPKCKKMAKKLGVKIVSIKEG